MTKVTHEWSNLTAASLSVVAVLYTLFRELKTNYYETAAKPIPARPLQSSAPAVCRPAIGCLPGDSRLLSRRTRCRRPTAACSRRRPMARRHQLQEPSTWLHAGTSTFNRHSFVWSQKLYVLRWWRFVLFCYRLSSSWFLRIEDQWWRHEGSLIGSPLQCFLSFNPSNVFGLPLNMLPWETQDRIGG